MLLALRSSPDALQHPTGLGNGRVRYQHRCRVFQEQVKLIARLVRYKYLHCREDGSAQYVARRENDPGRYLPRHEGDSLQYVGRLEDSTESLITLEGQGSVTNPVAEACEISPICPKASDGSQRNKTSNDTDSTLKGCYCVIESSTGTKVVNTPPKPNQRNQGSDVQKVTRDAHDGPGNDECIQNWKTCEKSQTLQSDNSNFENVRLPDHSHLLPSVAKECNAGPRTVTHISIAPVLCLEATVVGAIPVGEVSKRPPEDQHSVSSSTSDDSVALRITTEIDQAEYDNSDVGASLERPSQAIVRKIAADVIRAWNTDRALYKEKPGGHEGRSKQNAGKRTERNISGSGTGSGKQLSRKRSSPPSDNEDDPTDHPRRKKGRQSSSGHEEETLAVRLLACPYHKEDSSRYSQMNIAEKEYRGCSSRYLPNIARLKYGLFFDQQNQS
jgi:hypothetical protein